MRYFRPFFSYHQNLARFALSKALIKQNGHQEPKARIQFQSNKKNLEIEFFGSKS